MLASLFRSRLRRTAGAVWIAACVSLLGAAPVMVAAQAHGKTPAQVLLKWGVQRGTSIIPKTTKPERMRENLDIDDFELSAVEMAAISALNQNRRFNDPGVFAESAFGRFHPIYD